MRIGVIGAGYFGRLHALKLAQSARARLVGVSDADPARAAAVAAEIGTQAMARPALLAGCDAVVIAAPAEAHFALAGEALRAGVHVLVEKPMAATLAEADGLAELAAARGLVLQVGHLLRYSPEHAAIRARMPRPIYIECIRVAPLRPRGTDVSVVLDLMIHDLDLVLALVDSPIRSVEAIGAAVASGLDDIAEARIGFENGCVARLVASRIALTTERTMRLFGRDRYLSVDFAARRMTVVGRGEGVPLHQLEGAGRTEVTWEPADALEAEHAAFAASVLDGAAVVVDAAAGRRALAAALAVGEAIGVAWARVRAGGLLD